MTGTLGTLNVCQILCVLATFYVTACAQVVNIGLLFNSTRRENTPVNLAYEASLTIHLLLMGALVNSLGHGWKPLTLGLWIIFPPLEPLFWANAFIALFGTAICIARKKLVLIPDIAFALIMTPPAMTALESQLGSLVILDAAFFAFRTGSSVAYRIIIAKHFLPNTALIDVMRELPEGIAYFLRGRHIAFANDAMRNTLSEFGISVDLSSADQVVKNIESASGTWLSDHAEGELPSLAAGARKVLESPAGTFKEFSITGDASGTRTVLLCLDVTDERLIQEKEWAIKVQLENEREALTELLKRIEKVAEKDALVKMRSKIHDVIGQRLSILHRMLEGDLDHEKVAMMVSTVNDMMEDINGNTAPRAQTELDTIVESFGLAGIDIDIDGALPDTEKECDVLVGIIREASTNAVLHSHASRVHVLIERRNGKVITEIESDGEPLSVENRKGTGLAGMRCALAEVGGELRITRSPGYQLHIEMVESKPEGA